MDSRADADVEAVLEVCPDLDRGDIRADLAISGSVEATVVRALDGKFLVGVHNSGQPCQKTGTYNFCDDMLDLEAAASHSTSSRTQPVANNPNGKRSGFTNTVDLVSSDSDGDLPPFLLGSRTVNRVSSQQTIRESSTPWWRSSPTAETLGRVASRESSLTSPDSPEIIDTTSPQQCRVFRSSDSAPAVTLDITAKSSLDDKDIASTSGSTSTRGGGLMLQPNASESSSPDHCAKRKHRDIAVLSPPSDSDDDGCAAAIAAPRKRVRLSAEEQQRRKEEKMKEKAEKLAQREAEKKRKQLEKARQKAEKQFGNDVRRAGSRDNCIKTVQIVLDERLKEAAAWPDLASMLAEFELRVAFDKLPVDQSVTWRRANMEGLFSEDLQEMLRSERWSDENFAVVLWSAKEFIQHMHESSDNSSCAALIVAVKSLQEAFPGKEVTVLIEGIENYLHLLSREGKRNYRSTVLSLVSNDSQAQTGDSSRSKQRGKAGKERLINVTRVQVEEAFVTLQLLCPGVRMRLTKSTVDTAQLLFQLSKAVATRLRALEEVNPFGFFGDTSLKTAKVTSKGEGLLEVWQNQFRQFYNVGEEKAAAVAAVFPSPRLLLEALDRCASKKETEKLLTSIEVRRGTGILGRTTYIGKVFAEQLSRYALSRSGTVMVDGSTSS